ncbi:MAG: hypothetical protein U0586_15935 [Candidatus Brocadiaceae bacterium]
MPYIKKALDKYLPVEYSFIVYRAITMTLHLSSEYHPAEKEKKIRKAFVKQDTCVYLGR